MTTRHLSPHMVAFSTPLIEPALVLALLFVLVLVGPLAAKAVRMPPIIGLITTGILIGPSALGLLDREGTVEVLGNAGLLYLMFQAGLELDLEEFRERRSQAITFGALTFIIPFAVAIPVNLALGFSTTAALLLAVSWAPHTLLAYPVVQRLGLTKARSVAITVGATIITDTAALITLEILVEAHEGKLSPGFILKLIPTAGAVVAFIVAGLPWLGRRFFASVGQDRSVRFLFITAAMFLSAGLAELAGLEPIIGAFLAGLSLNRLVSEGSELSHRIEFFGSAFFIPVFLISVGMLVNLGVVVDDPTILLRAGVFSLVAVGTKMLAAFIAGKVFKFSGTEIGVMASLSTARAAATLAAAFVGLSVGLISEITVNTVVLVILVTSLVSSLLATRFGTQLPPPVERQRAPAATVLVPVGDPERSLGVLKLAGMLAAPDTGTVVPVSVLDLEATQTDVKERRAELAEAERVVLAEGAEATSVVRLDLTPSAGMLHASVEQAATSVLVGWKGFASRNGSAFGQRVDALLAASPVPVVVARMGPAENCGRVVVAVADHDLTPAGGPGVELAALVARRLAKAHRAELHILVPREQVTHETLGLEDDQGVLVVERRRPAVALRDLTTPGDIVVVTQPRVEPGLGGEVPRLARALPDRSLLVIAPR
ncbi:MAG: cation:proton antiporter [Microthrixaceae bacterium]|nr:cation:proton antiporter [Microthrixaceae bacterium]